MSDDPYMYNDQLQSSTSPLIGWNDLPQSLQMDIFEQVGSFHKVVYRRISHGWKNLLENWPRVLLLDETTQKSSSNIKQESWAAVFENFDREWQVYCHSDLITFAAQISSSVLHEERLLGFYQQSHKEFQGVLREAYKKARVIVIDLARTNFAVSFYFSFIDIQPYFNVMHYFEDEFSVAIGAEGNLQHVVLTGGRMSSYSYIGLISLLGLQKTQRPLKFSLIGCNVKWSTASPFLYSSSRRFPRRLCGVRTVNTKLVSSIFNSAKEDVVFRQFPLIFKSLIFPYADAQIGWLKNCLQTVQNLEDVSLSWDLDAQEVHCFYDFLKNCESMDQYGRDLISVKIGAPYHICPNPSIAQYTQCVEMLAVAVSYFGRMISTGQLDSPSPPEPVRLCLFILNRPSAHVC